MSLKHERYAGRGLSLLRTFNMAENFCRISEVNEAVEALRFAASKKIEVVVVGGGSNIFFKSTKIESFLLKNELPETIEYLGGDRFRVSASVPMLKLLKNMKELGRDTFYYLASAPCQIGGAIAMNAGSGPKEGLAISDFIESVECADFEDVKTYSKSEIDFSYRHSEFLAKPTRFITSAIFVFPEKKIEGDPIAARIEWARKNQDLSAPNCGSLCSKYDARILKFVRLLYSFFPTRLSGKKLNWVLNRAENPAWLTSMLWLIRFLHKIFGKKLKFELRIFE